MHGTGCPSPNLCLLHSCPPHDQVSSGSSNSSTSLFRASLALHWLSAPHITLRWLHIALVWLPTTRFFITRAPNMVTRLEVELRPPDPALAPNPQYSPTLAPYSLTL